MCRGTSWWSPRMRLGADVRLDEPSCARVAGSKLASDALDCSGQSQKYGSTGALLRRQRSVGMEDEVEG
jgi:hypothetical protein